MSDNSTNMKTQINYYSCKNNKYLASIDLSDIQSSGKEQEPIFICLLDKSGSMGGKPIK